MTSTEPNPTERGVADYVKPGGAGQACEVGDDRARHEAWRSGQAQRLREPTMPAHTRTCRTSLQRRIEGGIEESGIPLRERDKESLPEGLHVCHGVLESLDQGPCVQLGRKSGGPALENRRITHLAMPLVGPRLLGTRAGREALWPPTLQYVRQLTNARGIRRTRADGRYDDAPLDFAVGG